MSPDKSFRKPQELLDCFGLSETIFVALKECMKVDDRYVLDLSSVDAASPHLRDDRDVVAYAMRKAQGLRHVATPGTSTTNDVVVTLIAELTRVLEEVAEKLKERPSEDDATRRLQLLDIRDKVVKAGRRVCTIAGPDGDIVELI